MSKKRFLIVEDHLPTSDAIANYLRSFFPEWDITQAATQKEAVEKAQKENPDVVILDIALPDGDGLDIVRRFAKPDSPIKPKFVVVTALGAKSFQGPRPGKPWIDQLEPSEKSMVTALFHKPFNWRDFLTALAKAGQVPVPESVAEIDG